MPDASPLDRELREKALMYAISTGNHENAEQFLAFLSTGNREAKAEPAPRDPLPT